MPRQRKNINLILKNSIDKLSEKNRKIIFQVFGPIEELLKAKNPDKEFVLCIVRWIFVSFEQDSE